MKAIITEPVYEIDYITENEVKTAHIRASNKKEAQRILKKKTGALIKDMKITSEMGSAYSADNDKDLKFISPEKSWQLGEKDCYIYNNKTVETALEFYRRTRKLTQEELAEKSNVSVQSISRFENCERDIKQATADTVNRLAKALGVKIEDLI